MTTSTVRTTDARTDTGGDGPVAMPESGRRTRSLVWALAASEGRRLVRHPATIVGLLLSIAFHAVNTEGGPLPFTTDATDPVLVLPMVAARLGSHAMPLIVGLLMSAYLSTSRAGRSDADELLASAPARPPVRTLGALSAGLWSLGLVAAWLAVAIAFLFTFETIGAIPVSEVAQPFALAVAAHTTGVLLGTYVRSVGLFTLSMAGIAFLQLFLNAGSGGREHTLSPLYASPNHFLPELTVRPLAWHAVYVVGLAGLAAAAALLRHGPNRARLLAVVAAAGITGAGVIAQFEARPDLDTLRAMVALTEDLDRALVCTGDDTVQACTLPAYAGMQAAWRAPVQAALDALPADRRPATPLRVQQTVDRWEVRFDRWYSWEDQAQLRATLGLDPVGPNWGSHAQWPDVGDSLTGDVLSWTDARALALALEVTRRAVGIPGDDRSDYTWTAQDIAFMREHGILAATPEQDADLGLVEVPVAGDVVEVRQQCWLGGQAREAVAILLAASADRRLADSLRWMVDDRPYFGYDTDASGRVVSWYGPSMWHLAGGGAAVDWSLAGAHAARRLLDVPGAPDAIVADWDRWTAPDADVNDLLVAFDLPTLPTWAEHAREVGLDPDDPAGHDIDPLRYGGDWIDPTGAAGDEPAPLRWEPGPCGGPPFGSFAR